MVEVGAEKIRQRRKRVGGATLRDFEHHGFGLIDSLGDIFGKAVGHLGDFAGDTNKTAQQRVLFNDARVTRSARHRWRCCLQRDESCGTTNGIEQTRTAEFFGHRYRVGWFACSRQRGNGIEDVRVSRLIEVVGRQDFGRDRHCFFRKQHGAKKRLFSLEVVGRDPTGPSRAVGGSGFVVLTHEGTSLPRFGWGSLEGQPRFFRGTTLWTECGQPLRPVEDETCRNPYAPWDHSRNPL